MILFNKKFFTIAILMLIKTSYSQSIISPYEVGMWQDFRSAAVCFTFDDGCPNQLAVALPMFDKFGFKMTLFTVTNWSPNWDSLKIASSEGHEIASHTITHPHLDSLTDEKQTEEIKVSQDEINAHIKDAKCLTIAYPYCVIGNKSISEKYYIAARGCSGMIESSTPADLFNISSIVCGTLGSVKTVQDFCRMADSAAASKGLVVFLMHGIDNDGGYSPVTSENLKGALDYMKSNQSKFWVSTFGNIVKYLKERNAVSFKELSAKDNNIIFSLTDTLDNNIYNYPVSVRRQLPADWTAVLVSQNGKTINSQIVNIGSAKYVMFDAVPNSGNIMLSKN